MYRSDIIVYATVEEGHSATKDDVIEYLKKLKYDLRIGTPPFPSCVVLCGDQQTYSIIVELRKDNPTENAWFHAFPGDWHLMKLASEVIRDLVWDGGLKQFCGACGIKGELSQWQDIHIMLIGTYEALLETSIEKHKELKSKTPYWKWMKTFSAEENRNEVSKFWAQMLCVLHFYNGFYFAIRSGNWLLRNAFLKALSPIFFAFNRHKYEELIIENLYDTLTLPCTILNHLASGEWTVSIKGTPYCNLAIDEAHESVINRRFKQLTSRPSAFRTVELADFMSYMDSILFNFESYLFQHSNQSNSSHKKYIAERVYSIKNFISKCDSNLFQFSNVFKPLTNVFLRNAPKLDSVTRSDLISFYCVGKTRFLNKVCETVNNCKGKKKRNSKLKTFTKRIKTARENKNREKNLSEILSNAYTLLQAGEKVVQTCKFPLVY